MLTHRHELGKVMLFIFLLLFYLVGLFVVTYSGQAKQSSAVKQNDLPAWLCVT